MFGPSYGAIELTVHSAFARPSGYSGTGKACEKPSASQLQSPQVHLQVSHVYGRRVGVLAQAIFPLVLTTKIRH